MKLGNLAYDRDDHSRSGNIRSVTRYNAVLTSGERIPLPRVRLGRPGNLRYLELGRNRKS